MKDTYELKQKCFTYFTAKLSAYKVRSYMQYSFQNLLHTKILTQFQDT